MDEVNAAEWARIAASPVRPPPTANGLRLLASMAWMEKQIDFDLVPVGSVPWLPAEDWHPDAIVSRSRRRVRIVMVMAKHPGTGALTRLIAAIRREGLKPVVVAPHDRLARHLAALGWKKRYAHQDWEWFK